MIGKKLQEGLIKGTIVLVPTYITAYLTDKMIYVVPMLAAAGFIAAALFSDDTERRIDEYPAKEDDADSDTDGE
jgi:hypothetical protein|tara:strand:- start:279 stop:500 length:222 start_codon:yes stop_codon:yes gene_type:complete